jgi:hypothetical protein
MDSPPRHPPSFWRSPAGLTLLVTVAVGAFYLLTEHTAHLLGALPYLLLLACPLMHMFGGAVVHGVGMTLQYRLESREGPQLWWEGALFWLCGYAWRHWASGLPWAFWWRAEHLPLDLPTLGRLKLKGLEQESAPCLHLAPSTTIIQRTSANRSPRAATGCRRGPSSRDSPITTTTITTTPITTTPGMSITPMAATLMSAPLGLRPRPSGRE